MVRSTVSGNTSSNTRGGGGIYFFGATTYNGVTIRSSTIAGNTTFANGGGLLLRGLSGSVLIQNSTITGNTANHPGTTAGYGGGGIALMSGVSTSALKIESSIVSGNTAANGRSDIAAAAGPSVNVNFSAVGDPDGFTPSGTSGNNLPFGAALNLRPLGNYGGPTQTVALAPGSLALNTGRNLASETTDQRGAGYARVVGAGPDIGAYEVDFPRATGGPFAAVTIGGGATYTFAVTYTGTAPIAIS